MKTGEEAKERDKEKVLREESGATQEKNLAGNTGADTQTTFIQPTQWAHGER